MIVGKLGIWYFTPSQASIATRVLKKLSVKIYVYPFGMYNSSRYSVRRNANE